MATKLFVTGVTGYIGGDALFAIATAHPEYEITALVRNTDKGAAVASHFAKVRLVYGDLDSEDLIEKESAAAHIVCNWASADHEACLNAIIRGLSKKHSSAPGYLIQNSGAGLMTFEDIRNQRFGEALSDKVYNDLDGVHEVTSMPPDAPHVFADQIVLRAAEETKSVRTAIVCPPCIYGAGRGPDNQRSVQIPELCAATIKNGFTPKINAGQAWWNFVHVHDLSALYLLLVEKAAAGGETADWNGKPATWGKEGYYFCENEEFVWADVSQMIADQAKDMGLVEEAVVKGITVEEGKKIANAAGLLWGANTRGKAERAKVVLGWEAKKTLKEELKEQLEIEKKRVKVGHAAVAAGEARP
ncbi:putative nucleoside-diphosphate-sugar epimerase protein [Zymoseptoria brevis]|uniref:Putative nucleoside-diphosphate-sugar epimerase protein n=1 Tax=Zymoseptoria brevis TaxID=1047168 RepID=A0A0F4GX67_9PEZI|nr:putative nucleoside-diphosphate-sugar epimerase protein [Zymoseptoria brevis]